MDPLLKKALDDLEIEEQRPRKEFVRLCLFVIVILVISVFLPNNAWVYGFATLGAISSKILLLQLRREKNQERRRELEKKWRGGVQ